MRIEGLDDVLRNLDELTKDLLRKAHRGAELVAAFIENEAKADHGDTAREAGFVYPGGGVKRWRGSGQGWGDVTGNLNNSITAGIVEFTRDVIVVALTAGMDYAQFVELAQDGRWSWLWPTIDKNRDRIMQIWAKALAL